MRFGIYCAIAFSTATAVRVAIRGGEGDTPAHLQKDPLLDMLKGVEGGQNDLLERCMTVEKDVMKGTVNNAKVLKKEIQDGKPAKIIREEKEIERKRKAEKEAAAKKKAAQQKKK